MTNEIIWQNHVATTLQRHSNHMVTVENLLPKGPWEFSGLHWQYLE